jgi:transposase
VHIVTKVRQRKVVGILRDDRIATLEEFLSKIPRDKVKEVCIDIKEGLRKAAEAVFPLVRVLVDSFHVIANSNKRMDEARSMKQDVHQGRKVQIVQKIFLIAGKKLSGEARRKLNTLLAKYPSLKGFYRAKEKIRELYRQQTRKEVAKILDTLE